jgi:hypothetical protein
VLTAHSVGARSLPSRVERQLAACLHRGLLPSLGSRQSLADGSVYIGSIGIAYAFARLSQVLQKSQELQASVELSETRCTSLVAQLLAETRAGDRGSCSLMCVAGQLVPQPLRPAAARVVREIGVYWYLFSNHCTRKCIHKKVIIKQR